MFKSPLLVITLRPIFFSLNLRFESVIVNLPSLAIIAPAAVALSNVVMSSKTNSPVFVFSIKLPAAALSLFISPFLIVNLPLLIMNCSPSAGVAFNSLSFKSITSSTPSGITIGSVIVISSAKVACPPFLNAFFKSSIESIT